MSSVTRYLINFTRLKTGNKLMRKVMDRGSQGIHTTYKCYPE